MTLELAPYNILVNAIAPGYINTELTKKNNPPQVLKQIVEEIPLSRLGEPSKSRSVLRFSVRQKIRT